jgi:hypothetical protein
VRRAKVRPAAGQTADRGAGCSLGGEPLNDIIRKRDREGLFAAPAYEPAFPYLEPEIAILLRDAAPTRREFDVAAAAAATLAVEGRRRERNAQAAARWAAKWAATEIQAKAAGATRKLHAAYQLQKAEGRIDPRLAEVGRDFAERVWASANPAAEFARLWGAASGRGAPDQGRGDAGAERDFWIAVEAERRITGGEVPEDVYRDMANLGVYRPGRQRRAGPKADVIGRIHRLHRADKEVAAQLALEGADAQNLTTTEVEEALRDFFSEIMASRPNADAEGWVKS